MVLDGEPVRMKNEMLGFVLSINMFGQNKSSDI